MQLILHGALFACAMATASCLYAAERSNESTTPQVWLAASDQTLGQMRGGFSFSDGLTVTFGITRAIYLNGQLLATTVLHIGDLGQATKATGMPAAALALTTPAAVHIQIGPGNILDLGATPLPLATIIQNTLSNQTIRNVTTIDASTNSMGMLRGIQLQSSIAESIGTAGASR